MDIHGTNSHGRDDDYEKGSPADSTRKTPYDQQYTTDVSLEDAHHYSDPAEKGKSLHRDLTSRQISMIAIGGAIGMDAMTEARKFLY